MNCCAIIGFGTTRSPALSFSSSSSSVICSEGNGWRLTGIHSRIRMGRDRSKNRKPLQRGRNLSIEAIHTLQSLKRTNHQHQDSSSSSSSSSSLELVFASKFKRLLKNDMMAVLRELLRQNQCLLALKVFEDIQEEYWYKPQVSLYAEIISALGCNGLYERVELLVVQLKMETSLEPETVAFNALLKKLMNFNMTGLAMECFYLMKSLGCEPDKSSFRILINGLESKGEVGLSSNVRQEAEKFYGKSLEFLEEKEEDPVA
ncbi:hypothetical protein ACSBR1_020294 [Camellia fascicularis]